MASSTSAPASRTASYRAPATVAGQDAMAGSASAGFSASGSGGGCQHATVPAPDSHAARISSRKTYGPSAEVPFPHQ